MSRRAERLVMEEDAEEVAEHPVRVVGLSRFAPSR